jgi:hypothetical protein
MAMKNTKAERQRTSARLYQQCLTAHPAAAKTMPLRKFDCTLPITGKDPRAHTTTPGHRRHEAKTPAAAASTVMQR